MLFKNKSLILLTATASAGKSSDFPRDRITTASPQKFGEVFLRFMEKNPPSKRASPLIWIKQAQNRAKNEIIQTAWNSQIVPERPPHINIPPNKPPLKTHPMSLYGVLPLTDKTRANVRHSASAGLSDGFSGGTSVGMSVRISEIMSVLYPPPPLILT